MRSFHEVVSRFTSVERLEKRVLLSTSAETFYLRFNGANPGKWFTASAVTQKAPTSTTAGSLNVIASLDSNSAQFLPAVQKNKPFASIDLDIVKTLNGKPAVTNAFHFTDGSVHFLEFEGDASKTARELLRVSFVSEKNSSTKIPVPTVAAESPARGPFDLLITNANPLKDPTSQPSSPTTFRLQGFDLTERPAANGQLVLTRPFDTSKPDLAKFASNNSTLGGLGLLVQQGTGSKTEKEAFQITGVKVSSIELNGSDHSVSEKVSLNYSPISLQYKLSNSAASKPLAAPSAAGSLNFVLDLHQLGHSSHFNKIADFDVMLTGSASKPTINVNVTKPLTGKGLAKGEKFDVGSLILVDTTKHKVDEELFFTNVAITSVSRTTMNNMTTEKFSSSAKTIQIETTTNPPDPEFPLAPYNEVKNISDTDL